MKSTTLSAFIDEGPLHMHPQVGGQIHDYAQTWLFRFIKLLLFYLEHEKQVHNERKPYCISNYTKCFDYMSKISFSFQ